MKWATLLSVSFKWAHLFALLEPNSRLGPTPSCFSGMTAAQPPPPHLPCPPWQHLPRVRRLLQILGQLFRGGRCRWRLWDHIFPRDDGTSSILISIEESQGLIERACFQRNSHFFCNCSLFCTFYYQIERNIRKCRQILYSSFGSSTWPYKVYTEQIVSTKFFLLF